MPDQARAIGGSNYRRERRLIPPFGDGSNPNRLANLLDRTLSRCMFAPFADLQLMEDDCILDVSDNNRLIEPRFKLAIEDADELTHMLGCNLSDLALSLSARSRHLRRYEQLHEWPMSVLPDSVWSPTADQLKPLQTGRGMDFVLAIRVFSSNDRLARQGMSVGKALARKEFSIKEPTDSSTFPFEWVEFGGSTGYPEELLWTIKWHDADADAYDRPVNEALTVLANSKAEEKLSAMDAASGASGLAWRMLAAEITVQIWTDVLANTEEEPDEQDNETLVGQTFMRLASVNGKSYAEIKGLAKQEDSLSELRGLVYQLLKVVQ